MVLLLQSACLLPAVMVICFSFTGDAVRYDPNWSSLDARPLPTWYDEAKIGIFVHWGVFSVPSFGEFSEWFWYHWKSEIRTDVIQFMLENYPPSFEYADFASDFRAEFFDPDAWADIFKSSGARYCLPSTSLVIQMSTILVEFSKQ